jgi:hypothetical protein
MASEATTSWEVEKLKEYFVMKIAMTAHTDGSFVDYTIPGGYIGVVYDYYLSEAYVDPGSPAPTAGNYIKVTSERYGEPDIFQGALNGLSASDSVREVVPVRDFRIESPLKIKWTGNSVNGAKTDLYLKFEKLV